MPSMTWSNAPCAQASSIASNTRLSRISNHGASHKSSSTASHPRLRNMAARPSLRFRVPEYTCRKRFFLLPFGRGRLLSHSDRLLTEGGMGASAFSSRSRGTRTCGSTFSPCTAAGSSEGCASEGGGCAHALPLPLLTLTCFEHAPLEPRPPWATDVCLLGRLTIASIARHGVVLCRGGKLRRACTGCSRR